MLIFLNVLIITKLNFASQNLYKTDGFMQISRKNKLIFVHVPKTGGTTIEHSKLFDDAKKNHGIGGHYPIDDMTYNAKERQLEDFFKFSVVRHPCERFLSAYNFLKHHGYAHDQKWASQNIKNLSIDVVATKLLSGKLRYPHFCTQSKYLFTKQHQFNLDFVFCTSNFNDGLKNMALKLPHVPMSSFPISKGFKQQYHKNKFAHISCTKLNESTKKKIEILYALDYCVFNFSHDPQLVKEDCFQIQNQPTQEFTIRMQKCLQKNFFKDF